MVLKPKPSESRRTANISINFSLLIFFEMLKCHHIIYLNETEQNIHKNHNKELFLKKWLTNIIHREKRTNHEEGGCREYHVTSRMLRIHLSKCKLVLFSVIFRPIYPVPTGIDFFLFCEHCYRHLVKQCKTKSRLSCYGLTTPLNKFMWEILVIFVCPFSELY